MNKTQGPLLLENTKQRRVIKFYKHESLQPGHLQKNIKVAEIVLYILSLQWIYAKP